MRPTQAAPQGADPNDRLLFDAHPQPMWVFDQDSKRLLAVNAAALLRYGYTREEFLHLTVMDIRRTPQGRRLTAEQIDSDPVGADGLRPTRRWRHALKRGELIDVDVTSSDLDWAGRAARLVVVDEVTGQLATERDAERARGESKAAQELLNHVIDRVSDSIFALDTQLHFTYVNQPALRLLQRASADALIGRHIWDEYELEHARAFHNAYVRALQTQRPEVFEAHYAPWSKWVEVRVFPSLHGLSIFCNDITERKLFEQRLLERERDFRLLAEQTPALIYRAEAEAPFSALYVSPYVETLGYSAHEWLADAGAWSRLLHPDDRQRTLDVLANAYQDGRDVEVQYRLRDARGQWRHFRDRSRRVEPCQGQPAYVQGIALDVTDLLLAQNALLTHQFELSELNQRLMEQERLTTQRLAQALHDNLGQSLAVARLHLEALLVTSGATLAPELADQCHRLATVLAQAVLDVRQVLAELRPPLLEERGLAAALEDEVHAIPSAASVDVLLEVADGAHALRWPGDVAYTAFMVAREAVANARLHARASLIRILLAGDAHRLRLDVVDDGVGIAQELQLGRPGHLGIVGMRERAIAIGARFTLTDEPGGGTRVCLDWISPEP